MRPDTALTAETGAVPALRRRALRSTSSSSRRCQNSPAVGAPLRRNFTPTSGTGVPTCASSHASRPCDPSTATHRTKRLNVQRPLAPRPPALLARLSLRAVCSSSQRGPPASPLGPRRARDPAGVRVGHGLAARPGHPRGITDGQQGVRERVDGAEALLRGPRRAAAGVRLVWGLERERRRGGSGTPARGREGARRVISR